MKRPSHRRVALVIALSLLWDAADTRLIRAIGPRVANEAGTPPSSFGRHVFSAHALMSWSLFAPGKSHKTTPPVYQMIAPFVKRQTPRSHHSLIDGAGNDGERQSVMDRIEKKLRDQPDDVTLLTQYGSLMLKVGRLREALYYFQRAASLDQEDPRSYANIALAYAGMGKWHLAASAAAEQVYRDPGRPIAWFSLARYLDHAGKLDEATYANEEGLMRDPADAPARRSLIYYYFQRDRITKAMEHVNAYVGQLPNDLAIRRIQYKILLRLDRLRAIKKAAHDLLSSPDKKEPWFRPHLAFAHAMRAFVHWKEGRRADSANEFNRALVLNSREPLALWVMAKCLYAEGDLESTAQISDLLLTIDRNDPALVYLAIDIAESRGNAEKIIQIGRDALENWPHNRQILSRMANAYRHLGAPLEAGLFERRARAVTSADAAENDLFRAHDPQAGRSWRTHLPRWRERFLEIGVTPFQAASKIFEMARQKRDGEEQRLVRSIQDYLANHTWPEYWQAYEQSLIIRLHGLEGILTAAIHAERSVFGKGPMSKLTVWLVVVMRLIAHNWENPNAALSKDTPRSLSRNA